MAAMKPRTGDGPLEVTKEGRDIVMRMPLDGGGRLVVEMTPDEANALGDALKGAAVVPKATCIPCSRRSSNATRFNAGTVRPARFALPSAWR